jgi:hypothetical protein
VPNGQPKLLLNLFLPGYPLVNFALCTAVYVFVSYRLFFLTNALKNVAIPGKEMGLLWRNGAIMAVAAAVSILFALCNASCSDSQMKLRVVHTYRTGLAMPCPFQKLDSISDAGPVCSGSVCSAVQRSVGHPVDGQHGGWWFRAMHKYWGPF